MRSYVSSLRSCLLAPAHYSNSRPFVTSAPAVQAKESCKNVTPRDLKYDERTHTPEDCDRVHQYKQSLDISVTRVSVGQPNIWWDHVQQWTTLDNGLPQSGNVLLMNEESTPTNPTALRHPRLTQALKVVFDTIHFMKVLPRDAPLNT